MERVEKLLRSEIGLDAATLGPTSVARAAHSRMKALGLKSIEDYHRLLDSSAAERAELVESVVVTETWFFRDRDAFSAFTQLAQEWLARNPAARLRALSVPCSSGEEPYTLAMCLLDAGVPPERFTIDAVDISARSLARAGAGVYGKNSFRGDDLAFRARHFHHGKGGYTIHQRVRDCVRFQQDNLLNGKFLEGREPYPFVFCRNVLIYFDRPTQSKVLATLNEKIAGDGFLFVGPAEMPVLLDSGFVSADLPKAFTCRKTCGVESAQKGKGAEEKRTRGERERLPSGARIPPASSPLFPFSQPQPDLSAPPAAPDTGLETARQLADAGKLSEAATLCEEHARQNGPSAAAFYLLGLVLDARGDASAADYYRKALYLDPHHYEALWHMALLLEKNGDHEGAGAFKQRAQRAQKNAAPN